MSMSMRGLTLKALALAVGIAVVPASNAYMLLDTDVHKFRVKIQDNMHRMVEAAQKMAAEAAKLKAYGQAAEDKVNATNNGFANLVARTQQAASDVFNLEQNSKARPVQDACRAVAVQQSNIVTACIEEDFQALIRDKLRGKAENLVETFRKRAGDLLSSNEAGAYSGFEPYRIASSNSSEKGAVKKEDPDIEVFYREIESYVDKYADIEKKGGNPGDPRLFVLTNTIAPVYDEKELETTLNTALLVYPRFVRKHNEEPMDERELLNDMRKKQFIESVNEVIARHISLRTPVEAGMPSKLMALTLPAMLYLDAESELLPDGEESWLKKVSVNMDTSPGEISRDKVIMKAVKLEQAFEAYKSSLLIERLLLNRYMAKVDSL